MLSLLVLVGGDLLSGGGDCNIMRWRKGTCIDIFDKHTDSVRYFAIRIYASLHAGVSVLVVSCVYRYLILANSIALYWIGRVY